MADCAAVGCPDPALEVWRPSERDTPRFHYLVCQFHAAALRSDARYSIDEHGLDIAPLPQLRDWNVVQTGGHAIVRLVYGDELDTVKVELQADPAMVDHLRKSIASLQSLEGEDF